jgi:hypothetical protein
MRIPDRNTAVFSTSAIDLFASALGAFILLVMLLFPYYRNAGSDASFSKTEDIMQQRRLAAGEIEELLADQHVAQSQLQELDAVNRGIEAQISRIKNKMANIKSQIAEIPVRETETVEEIIEEAEPEALTAGVEFSILGLATEAKSFVIVIDMSGSMLSYATLMIKSVLEVLEPLDESNEFAIIGYQGAPSPVLWSYPDGTGLIQASADNLEDAKAFTESLARRFSGSTPTHHALKSAMQYPAKSIILMSDGEPDNSPAFIIQEIASLNRFENKEIHTVAIGDYTQNRGLVMFLQELARQNGGDFVGVSR